VTYHTATDAWVYLLTNVAILGERQKPRGLETRELLGYQFRVDMEYPVVNVKARELGFRFLAAEAFWILNGDNRVSTISPFSKAIANFSDDGVYFAGAYGPRVVDQLSYVVDQLVADPSTRQAVLTIWRPNPRPSKDIPCTIACQWLIRPHWETKEPALYCIDTMRSSDAWLGVPYDVFNFSQLSLRIALLLRNRGLLVRLGGLVLQAGSQHLYEKDWEAARKIITGPGLDPEPDLKVNPHFKVSEFADPETHLDFLSHALNDGRSWFEAAWPAEEGSQK